MADTVPELPMPPGGKDAAAAVPSLTATELAMLALERQRWKYAGAKDARIREKFAMSPTRYYQILNTLIDKPSAVAVDPVTVHRLRRLREQRRMARGHISD